MQRSTLLCFLSIVTVAVGASISEQIARSIGNGLPAIPGVNEPINGVRVFPRDVQSRRNIIEDIVRGFEDAIDRFSGSSSEESSEERRPPRPPVGPGGPGSRPPRPPGGPGSRPPRPPGGPGSRPPPVGPVGPGQRPPRPPAGPGSRPPSPNNSTSPSNSSVSDQQAPSNSSVPENQPAPSNSSAPSNSTRVPRASAPFIPGFPAIPNVDQLVPQLPNSNGANVQVPPIRQPRAVSEDQTNAVTSALDEARRRVENALGITGNLVDGLRTAIEQAFDSQDPTGAIRTIVNTVLNAYLDVALNCPMLVIGIRVAQEGIRLAGEVAASARNVIFG